MADGGGGGGYDFGVGLSSSSPSGSSANSPFNIQGGGGSLQIFGPYSHTIGTPSTPTNPKTVLYGAIGVGVAVVGIILIFLFLKK